MILGKILEINIANDAGSPMVSMIEAELVENGGLKSDRYQLNKGSFTFSKRQTIRQLSLISSEAIKEANDINKTNFSFAESRRNILTEGVDLNSLVGAHFSIGDVPVLGIELCTPCDRPTELSKKEGFRSAFENRGGLRVQVLGSGLIKVGTIITK